MTIDQLIAKFQSSDEFAPAFKPSGATGSGASNGRSQKSGAQGSSSDGSTTTIKSSRVITGVDPADITSGKVKVAAD
jgi:hypothetical protein